MNIANQQPIDSAVLAQQDQQPVQYVTPLADVESTNEGYTIHAEMPGVDKSGSLGVQDRFPTPTVPRTTLNRGSV